MTATLPFLTALDREHAAQFLAELVRQGICFRADLPNEYEIRIAFTGGH